MTRPHTRRALLQALGAAPLALAGGLPARALQVNPQAYVREGSLAYKDPRLPANLPTRGWKMYVARENRKDYDYGPAKDPKFNADYRKRLQVDCYPKVAENEHERRFVIHFQKDTDEALARLVGSVMARLYWTVEDYLGRGPETRYINVWLSHEGKAGAEQYEKDIYVYAVDEPRAPAEWVRELAHEYGHLYLPPSGPFSAPEKLANGYLGERLFMKWMLADNGPQPVWDQPIDGAAYVANQIAPLRDRFLNEGPAPAAVMDRLDAEAMNQFLGQMLAVEAIYGPTFLRSVLDRFATPRPQNLGGYITIAVNDLKPVKLSVDPAAFVPSRSQVETPAAEGSAAKLKKAAYWVFIAGGDWQIEAQGVPAGTKATLEATELPKTGTSVPGATAWSTSSAAINGMWRRLELTAPEGSVLEIRQLTVSRRGG